MKRLFLAIGALVVKKTVALYTFYLFGSEIASHGHSPFIVQYVFDYIYNKYNTSSDLKDTI